MHEFLCIQDENHLITVDALSLHRFITHRLPCLPSFTYCFMPQLPDQLSSAINPGLATLVNGIQCPLGDKALLHLTKTSTSNIKDGNIDGTPQLQDSIKSPISLFANSSFNLSSLRLPTSSLGWDATILLVLSCNFRVATTSLWSVLRN